MHALCAFWTSTLQVQCISSMQRRAQRLAGLVQAIIQMCGAYYCFENLVSSTTVAYQ
jgi:hypothetical protein